MHNLVEISVGAYQLLGMDGLIDIYVPKDQDDFHCVDHNTYQRAKKALTMEETLTMIESLLKLNAKSPLLDWLAI